MKPKFLRGRPLRSAAKALRSAVFALGVFLIVRNSEDLIRVGVVEVAAAFAATAYYLAAQRAVGVRMIWRPEMLRAWPLIRTGAAVGASNVVWTFMLYAPIFLVTNLSGTAEAAWLGGAQRIVYSLVGFSAVYFFNLYPVIARALHQSRPQWEALIGSSYRVVAWASLGVAMVSTILAEAIVVLAFGEAFAMAASVFSIYIWLLPVRLLSGHARWALVAGERQAYLLASEALATVALLALGVALIPSYGAVGAATSVITANMVGWLSAHIFAERHVGGMPGMRDTLLPVGSALACVALSRVFGSSPATSTGVAIAAFVVCVRLGAGDLVADVKRLAFTKKAGAE